MKKNIILALFCVVNLLLSTQISNAQWEELTKDYIYFGIVRDIGFIGNDIFLVKTSILEEAGVFLSANNGNTWIQKNGTLKDQQFINMAINNNILYVGCDLGVFISTDKGDTWSQNNSGLTNIKIRSFGFTDKNIFIGTLSGIFFSSDDGTSWIKNNSSLSNMAINNIILNGNNMFASVWCEGIFFSSDNGVTWVSKHTGLFSRCINALAIKDSLILAGVESLYISSDNGDSWKTQKYEELNGSVNTIDINGTCIFIGTTNGVFLSIDNGDSWVKKNKGLEGKSIFSLASNNDYIFAGTDNGVFRAKISDLITDVEIEKKENQQIQIYPNPTSNILNLNLDNILSTDISHIKIYSGLGYEIESPKPIINENNIQLDVSSLPQGVYYISFFNKGKVERARFVKIMDN